MSGYAGLLLLSGARTLPGIGVFVRATADGVGREALYDELTALEDTFLREASALGFSLDEVIIHLDSRRNA